MCVAGLPAAGDSLRRAIKINILIRLLREGVRQATLAGAEGFLRPGEVLGAWPGGLPGYWPRIRYRGRPCT